jgi:hypothetical protein
MRRKLALLAGAAVVATLAIAVAPDANAAVTVNWSAGSLTDAATSATPAMTTCNGITYMVWKGIGNDTRLFYSLSGDPGRWAPQQLVGGGGGTNTGPTVACDWNNQIVVAWKGLGSDEHIYYTMAEVENNRDEPPHPLQWTAQKVVDGGAVTDLTPSLAVLRGGFDAGTLYLAWRGAGGDTSVHYATLPGFTSPWQQLGTVPGVSTVRSPTLTDGLSAPSASPKLSLIWPLAGGQNIYSTTYLGGSSWTSPVPIVGGSGAAPAATEGPADGYNAPDNLVAWQGSGTDTRIFYTVDQNWSGWQPQQVVTNGGPTTAGVAAADNVQCPNGRCTLITAYIAWRGPQSQVEFVYGAY